MANFLFPPIVPSALTPLEINNENNGIVLDYKDSEKAQDYNYIRVRIVRQSDNRSLVNINRWKDQFIYYTKPDNNELVILFEDFDTSNLVGQIIKIQLSYVTDIDRIPGIDGESRYFSDLENATFSEWSSVTVLKFIEISNEPEIVTTESISLTPQFKAGYSFTEASKETRDRYKFSLYRNGFLLESSDWIKSTDTTDTYRFKTALQDCETYKIKYESYSKNNYYVEVVNNNYTAYDNTTEQLPAKMSTVINYEDACVDIYYEWLDNSLETGGYVVARSSDRDNFSKWEDLYYFYLVGFEDKTLVFTDFTVESGVVYKYCIQKQYSETGLRSARLFDKEVSSVCVYLPYAYLYEKGIQLKLKYNNKLSSYKHTTITSKQDTLGSKYPSIVRNGSAYYAEFPINGLISLHADDGERFFKKTPSGYVYKDQVVIPVSKYLNDPFDVNLTDSNFYIERMFREKVEEFLNNGSYKIFRSPVVGNHIVTLMNIQLSPNQTLGGMIAEFSGTAYEVLDWDYSQMLEFGIIENNKENEKLLTQEVTILGKVEMPTAARSDLRAAVKKALQDKYNVDEFIITSIDIDKGYNDTLPNLTIEDNGQTLNTTKTVGTNLNVTLNEDTKYPIYIGYSVITKYKESVYNGGNLMSSNTSIKEVEDEFTAEDEIGDVIQAIKEKTNMLRLISIEFSGPGFVTIDGTEHVISYTGLKFARATDISSITNLSAGVTCSYKVLVQESKGA